MNNTLNKYIDKMKDEIINKTCGIINIPSVLNNSDNTPFGIHTVEALNYMLDLGKSFGFRTKNIDNMCGYVEFGEGTKLLGIIAHLDVVPADNGWTYSPFNATIDNNNIYGRGTIDDKGPSMAALYAMKAVADNYELKDKRVRLILGLNEENSWKCIEKYKETEELPDVAFSPDANFPCIYAEKTIESLYIKQKYIKNPTLYIEHISTNNNAINVVPKYCSVTLGFDDYKITDIIKKTKELIVKHNYNINIEEIDHSHIKLISLGTASHAVHPELGNNALSKLLIILYGLFNEYNNSNLEPMAIGGGTYARAFENCVSFGPQMPNAKDMCHQTDEYISIENLMFCTKVYAKAILEL